MSYFDPGDITYENFGLIRISPQGKRERTNDYIDRQLREQMAWKQLVIDHPHPNIADTPLLSDKPDLNNLEMTINQAVASQYIAITPEDSVYSINHVATRKNLAPITTKSPEIKLEQDPNNKQYYLTVKSQGFWLNNPSSLDYQWYIDDVGQFGEYSSILNVYPKDDGDGKQFRCNVRATNAYGSAIAPSNTMRIAFPKEQKTVLGALYARQQAENLDTLPESQQFWSKAAELAVKDINEFERDLGLNKTCLGFSDERIMIVAGDNCPVWDSLWKEAATKTIEEMGRVVPLLIDGDRIVLNPDLRWISQTDQRLLEQKDITREKICPLCGSVDSFNNDKCRVCNFIRPNDDIHINDKICYCKKCMEVIHEMKKNRKVNLKLSKCNNCNGNGFDNEQGLCVKCGYDEAWETFSINSTFYKRNITSIKEDLNESLFV